MRRRERRWCDPKGGPVWAVVLAALSAAAPLSGQDDGFTLVGGVAYEPGGPGPALASALEQAGFDDRSLGGCAGSRCPSAVQYPFYANAGIDMVALGGFRYRTQGLFSVEALLSNAQRGRAEGYNASTREHLAVAYASIILTGTVGIHLGPLRLEAGPALNRTGWEATRNSARTLKGSTVTLGGMAAASAELRVGRALFSLKAGLRTFPPVDLWSPVQLSMSAGYHSALIGVTLTQWVR